MSLSLLIVCMIADMVMSRRNASGYEDGSSLPPREDGLTTMCKRKERTAMYNME